MNECSNEIYSQRDKDVSAYPIRIDTTFAYAQTQTHIAPNQTHLFLIEI